MRAARQTTLWFAATIFVGATLLFTCQPLVARMILPLLGGAPSVWIVCSLCFQTLLLAGYGYAHFVGTRLPVRVQAVLQLALVASVFLVMPVAVDEHVVERLTAGHPTAGVVVLVVRTIGLPFFVLSTSSPLLQRWCAEVGERDPYHLYAASNAGSMLALLGYPLVVEPSLSVRGQSRAMSGLFAFYTFFVLVCAVLAARRQARAPLSMETTPAPPQVRVSLSGFSTPEPVPTSRQRWLERFSWIALSFAPSSLLLGTTEYVTTEIASVPLLWVLPLALYLLSFIFAFAKKQPLSANAWSRLLAVLAVVVTVLTLARVALPHWPLAAAHMTLLMVASVVCHRALALRRPRVARLTEFYLLLSIGGVLGGAFNGILAPLVFNDLYEYPIAIALACLGRVALRQDLLPARRRRHVAFALVVGGLLAAAVYVNGTVGTTLWAHRGFFGVLKVAQDERRRLLLSGSVYQGEQSLDPAAADLPLGHYRRKGAAGDVLGPPDMMGTPPPRRVGVIGLGVGSLAAYARRGDDWTFFELDPAVVEVARSYFGYVKSAEARARVTIEVGDARLRLRDGDAARFDVLVLDAFSTDAVPVHLVTREALAVYRRALRPGGLVLVNVTNEHVALAPVFAALARSEGMVAIERRDAAAEWVVLSSSPVDLEGWQPLEVPAATSPWTDDHADVLGALRF